MIQYRKLLVTLLLLTVGAHHSNAQVVCSIDSVKIYDALDKSDFLYGIVSDDGPYICIYSTIRNDGVEDVLMSTLPKDRQTNFWMGMNLQLEFKYQGQIYANWPVGESVTNSPMFYNVNNFDLYGTDQEALVLKPGESITGWEFDLCPFNGCELSSLPNYHKSDLDNRYEEWMRLYGIINEIIPSLYIRIYVELKYWGEDRETEELLKEAFPSRIITSR